MCCRVREEDMRRSTHREQELVSLISRDDDEDNDDDDDEDNDDDGDGDGDYHDHDDVDNADDGDWDDKSPSLMTI